MLYEVNFNNCRNNDFVSINYFFGNKYFLLNWLLGTIMMKQMSNNDGKTSGGRAGNSKYSVVMIILPFIWILKTHQNER